MTPSSFPKYEISNKPRTVYFADPYSGWQRGTNDHFSGRIRKYLPKGTSFENLTQVKLNEFINRRRNVLGWATPAAVFQELCSK